MPSTRHSTDGKFHAARFASSEAFEKPLPGNLVAKRARLLTDPEERAVVYWLQQLSHHREGGLHGVAEELLATYRRELGTAAMHRAGLTENPQRRLSRGEVAEIREEIRLPDVDYPLRGEIGRERRSDPYDLTSWAAPALDEEEREAEAAQRWHEAQMHPEGYTLAEMLDDVQAAATVEAIEAILNELPVNPELTFAKAAERAWYFRDFRELLLNFRRRTAAAAADAIAETSLSAKVEEALDFGFEERSLVLIEGLERSGKTTAARYFCDRHPGQAVFVPLESGNDMASFYRSLARRLGVSSTAQRKAAEIRARIEEMLHGGHLMLVIDEAHFLFPQTERARKAPEKLDWLRTGLVDHGVPVALICTPQYDRALDQIEKRLGWNARQFKGRIALHETLPETLTTADMAAIARHKLPGIAPDCVAELVAVARSSDEYVATIERALKRARYFAKKRGESEPNAEDIERAVDEISPMSEPETAPKPSQEPAGRSQESVSQRQGNRAPKRDHREVSNDRYSEADSGLNYSLNT